MEYRKKDPGKFRLLVRWPQTIVLGWVGALVKSKDMAMSKETLLTVPGIFFAMTLVMCMVVRSLASTLLNKLGKGKLEEPEVPGWLENIVPEKMIFDSIPVGRKDAYRFWKHYCGMCRVLKYDDLAAQGQCRLDEVREDLLVIKLAKI